ncbi:MAG: DUF5916 domain-containing protein [Planctomycetota bacterium]
MRTWTTIRRLAPASDKSLRRRGLLAGVALAVLASGGRLAAQKPSVAPTRLTKAQKIRIDGRFLEPAWQGAAELGPLTQVDPIEGAKPAKPTRVRFCYDADHLYLAIECSDDPKKVHARLMERDIRLDPDDRVEFWIDTFNDQRFAFWFQIGAAGAKGDALLADSGSSFNKSWDAIWYAKTRITSKGWQAEIALPFKTLAFKEDLTEWGFNLVRERKANDEEDRWASPLVAYSFFTLTEGGKLTGLTGMRQGLGIDVVPYTKGRLTRERLDTDDDYHRLGDVGGDIRYRITPALDLRLTVNTDFAETEVDDRQINLTRFPLFFPEKRDFFLEDAGVFEFGPQERGRNDLIPFFSRRIGLDEDGEEIDLLAGAKLTGRAGDWNIGALTVLQDDHNDVPEKGLGVLRTSYNLGGENAVGMIVTGGQPTARGDAYTAGVDFRFGSSRAFGEGRALSVWGYWAYGLQAQYDSTEWNHLLSAKSFDTDFDPKLGFVRRTGIIEYRWRTRYTWRNQEGGLLRSFSTRVVPRIVTTEGGSKDTWDVGMRWFELTFDSDDSIEFETRRGFERLRENFEIQTGIVIPTGDYNFLRHAVEFRTAERRAFNLDVELEWGEFWSGNITTWEVSPTWLINKYVQVSGAYRDDNVHLDEGDFTSRIVEGRVDLQFSPFVSWNNLVQFDNDSDVLSFQSRFRWIFEPGSELFLVGLYGWQKGPDDDTFRPDNQDLSLKVQYTFRF